MQPPISKISASIWGRKAKDPAEWNTLVDWNPDPAHSPQDIYEWDLTEVQAPVVTVRVIIRSTVNTQAESAIPSLLKFRPQRPQRRLHQP